MSYNAPDTAAGHELMGKLLDTGKITQQQFDAWVDRIQDQRASGAWGN
jgi:hypothetical protein